MPTRRPFPLALAATAAALVAVAAPAALRADDDDRRVVVRAAPRVVVKTSPGSRLLVARPRAFLGVELTPLTPELRRHFGADEEAGVMIGRLVDSSPAAAAGLAVGDVVTRVAGEAITSSWQLARVIGHRDEGDEVEVEYVRGGRAATTTAKLALADDLGPDLLPKVRLDLGSLGDLGDLGNLKALSELRRLELLGDVDVDLDLDPEVMKKVESALEDVFSREDWKRELERVRELDLERVERRMEEVRRELERVQRRLEREGGKGQV